MKNEALPAATLSAQSVHIVSLDRRAPRVGQTSLAKRYHYKISGAGSAPEVLFSLLLQL